jgi:opacity protein-like surface antigen
MNYEPERNGAFFMRKTVIVAAFSVLTFGLCAGIAGAQVRTSGNVYFGYTYYNTSLAPNRGGLNGWQGTLEGKLFPLLGIVADLTGQYGSLDLGEICPVVPIGGGGGGCTTFNLSTHEYNAMFGPRVGTTIGKFRPFGEFEIGVGHVSASSESNTSFATALGGGMDYKIFHAVAWRVEGDYVHTRFFSAGQNNVRISTGIVLRF